jgi:hypothetical protein
MVETIIIDVDDEHAPIPKTHKLVVTDVDCKFQEIWALKMPWAKPIFNEVGVVFTMKCCVCTIVETKEKIQIVNWDSIENMWVRKNVQMVSGSWIQNVCM